jgi:hypothetical protein
MKEKENQGEIDQEIENLLNTFVPQQKVLMHLAERRRNFGVAVLLMAILSAVFGIYIDKPDASFYRYSFLGYSVVLMFGGAWYFDSANKLTRKAFEEANKASAKTKLDLSESPDPNDGGQGIRRVK